ncbi:MAG: SUMF1/EgtB/PvdO family nonheme iron enzyme, partial [Chitinivibrionales bacterium]|nr:SUMF1/EgtB/PvdO family nonheme iron enzyme [Chitinivibrionales bacterium]MBD3396213.1 SUMF1/EgtB/PvdO family nonheme iron enzyme [Chitinivibrionales bacterium]
LPTEAEWEFACRAGSADAYYWGDSVDSDFCVYDADAADSTSPVASRMPNAFGLYDMSGNVWEWCNDWYASYDTSECIDPRGPAGGAEKVFRGGSWFSHAPSQRSANRNSNLPLYRSKDLGFRTILPAQQGDRE